MNDLLDVAAELSDAVDRLRFGPPVTHVYNPLAYARQPYTRYIERFGAPPREIVLVGMNPGPFGMTQTGVPFGEVAMVRDWLGLEAPVGRPRRQHVKRPIEGFACRRSEVSGARLWGWAKDRFGSAESFFAHFFVANYCPLVFMEDSGRNRTPDKLALEERRRLYAVCDRALRRTIDILAPRLVIGIGAFAEARAKEALAGTDVRIGRILHPSPASPLANRDWGGQVERELLALGLGLVPAAARR